MLLLDTMEMQRLQQRLVRLRGNPHCLPDAAIILPVNARADLGTVLTLLRDITLYGGTHTMEVILVINNYADDSPPVAIEQFRALGARVVAVPSARRPGEVVIVSARALGVQAAQAAVTVHFDADCRIPNIRALIDWYVRVLRCGTRLAYSRVGYYDVHHCASVWALLGLHHTARWVKRNLLGIPTTRGSNYAIDRQLFLHLYTAGKLSVDLHLGPAAKLAGARVVYGRQRRLHVLTSGRKLHLGWGELVSYGYYRLWYNFHALPHRFRALTPLHWDGYDRESQRRERLDQPG